MYLTIYLQMENKGMTCEQTGQYFPEMANSLSLAVSYYRQILDPAIKHASLENPGNKVGSKT